MSEKPFLCGDCHDCGAKSGNIKINVRQSFHAGLIVYLLPVISLFLGYGFGVGVAFLLKLDSLAEMLGVIFSLSFLAGSFLLVRWYNNRVA
jgi:positive regulator of sigma E activity